MPKINSVEFHSNVNVKDSVFIFCSTFLFCKIDCQWSLTFLVRLILFPGLSSSATQQGQCCYLVVNVNAGKTMLLPSKLVFCILLPVYRAWPWLANEDAQCLRQNSYTALTPAYTKISCGTFFFWQLREAMLKLWYQINC